MAEPITIRVRNGLIYRILQSEAVLMEASDADVIARKNGFYFAEQFVRAHTGRTFYLNEDWRIMPKRPSAVGPELAAAIDEAKTALVLDSNDAEHDALVSLMLALGQGEVPECDCDTPYFGRDKGHKPDCPCAAWEGGGK